MMRIDEFLENVNKIAAEKGQPLLTVDNQFVRLAYEGYCRSENARKAQAIPSDQLTRILRRKADFPVMGKDKLKDLVLEQLVHSGRFLDNKAMYTGPFDQTDSNSMLNAASYLLRSTMEKVDLVPWFGYRLVPQQKARSFWETSYWLMDPSGEELYEPSKILGKYHFGYPIKPERFLRSAFGLDQQQLDLLLGK